MYELAELALMDPDSLLFLAGWTILNKSQWPKKVYMQLRGNISGQVRTIPPFASVTMPDNPRYRFWDAETRIEIIPRRQVIVNRQGMFE